MTRMYEDFARKHLDIVNTTGDEAMVRCVVHDDSKASMQFNLRSGLWVCFACHAGGSIKRLCRELGISTFSEPEPDLNSVRCSTLTAQHRALPRRIAPHQVCACRRSLKNRCASHPGRPKQGEERERYEHNNGLGRERAPGGTRKTWVSSAMPSIWSRT